MAGGLQTLGVKAEPTPDGIIIEGGAIGGGEVWAHGDHRIAMSFSVASLRASAPIRIHACANVATSFPNSLALSAEVGINVAEADKRSEERREGKRGESTRRNGRYQA